MDIRPISAAGYNLWASGVCEEEIGGGGYIQLEPGWQIIATPVIHGYWDTGLSRHIHDDVTVARFENYIYDQIVDLYGTGRIEVANTYLGDNQFFWSYVPGITPTSSPHNFQLVYIDGSYQEIAGYWVKSLHTIDMTIQWGEV